MSFLSPPPVSPDPLPDRGITGPPFLRNPLLRSPLWRWVALLATCGLVVLWALARGSVPISPLDVFSADSTRAEVARRIFGTLRGPRVLCALLVGAGLSVAGAALQGAFRNPLAEPYLLGISAGGALGATLALWAKLPAWGAFEAPTGAAFVGALLTAALVYALARPSRASLLTGTASLDRATLLLAGVALSAFLSALLSLVVALTGRYDLERQTQFWLLGGLQNARLQDVPALSLALCVGLGILLASARDINALRGGRRGSGFAGGVGCGFAKTFIVCGVPFSRGVRGDGGVSRVCRAFSASCHALALWHGRARSAARCCRGGSDVLVLADLLARSLLPPIEIPLGVVTALFGVPLFLYLARRR